MPKTKQTKEKTLLTEVAAKDTLKKAGVPVVETRLCADPAEAVACYIAAIEEARILGLDTIELQARIHLVAHNRRLGIVPDGTEALADVAGTFAEGHDEALLVEARRLLASAPAGHQKEDT